MIIYVQPPLYIYIFIFIFAYLIFTYLINFFWLNIKITKDGINMVLMPSCNLISVALYPDSASADDKYFFQDVY